MKEIVDRILKEEESARIRIEKARAEADGIVAKAKDESRSLAEDAIAKTAAIVQQKKEDSRKQFLSDKERILRESEGSAALARNNREKDIRNIAQEVFSRIITIKE